MSEHLKGLVEGLVEALAEASKEGGLIERTVAAAEESGAGRAEVAVSCGDYKIWVVAQRRSTADPEEDRKRAMERLMRAVEALEAEDVEELAQQVERGEWQPVARCRVCGALACPGGCYWVEEDLCSECADDCPTCIGIGVDESGRPCDDCRGRGTARAFEQEMERRERDEERRAEAMEAEHRERAAGKEEG